jgi:pyruvate kinase
MVEKTKIVCTIGSVADKHDCLKELVKAGMDIMRLNFSHGTLLEHKSRVNQLRKITDNVEIIQDLCGPKIRIGTFAGGKKGNNVDNGNTGSIELKKGETFTLTAREVIGNEKIVSINYKALPHEVKVGAHIMLDDGTKKLLVHEIKGEDIITKVIIGGTLSGEKGINVPGVKLSAESLTQKDRHDLEFGIHNKVDYIALSFVREASDIAELRKILKAHGSKARIIAKIETTDAVRNIDSIIEASDGIMVARGDLAIEIGIEKVPMVQKIIIHKCNVAGKMVIVATQMLESMVTNPTPTRAEVSDIANAVMDGATAIMLSEETAVGIHPVEAVKVMSRVIREVEKEMFSFS